MRRTALLTVLLLSCTLTGCGLVSGPNPLLNTTSGVVTIWCGPSGGTGWVAKDEGETVLVVTAAHVVDLADEVTVAGQAGTVIARDYDNDLAIIRMARSLLPRTIWKMRAAKQGESATAIGYTWPNKPEDDRPVFMVYPGSVTSTNFEGCVSFNGGVFPGLSGGPLVAADGKVLGVCSRFGVAWGLPFETATLFTSISYVQALLATITD